MITVVDTNIFVALWHGEETASHSVQNALDACLDKGVLVVIAPVFAELIASPTRTEEFLDDFFPRTGVVIDWNLAEAVWRSAGVAFRAYTKRRRKEGTGEPRRILADFLIGAYAQHRRARLLTLDQRIYRTAFPDLTVIDL